MFKQAFFIFVNVALSAYELSVLAMFRDESKYLKEWVDYHRTVGVEHFWLYNDHSDDCWGEVLQEYIDAGVLEVVDWQEGGNDYGYLRQPSIYKDGVAKAVGKTKWLAIIDIDEFIVPMKEETILDCLDKHYCDAAAIYVNWRNFGTGDVTVPEGESMLYHLKACSLASHSRNAVGKCIVKPENIIIEEIWTPHHYRIKAEGQYFNGDGKPMKMEDGEVEIEPSHRSKYIRINHYPLRDEWFFWNCRYQRTQERALALEHRDAFSLTKDFAIQRFVKKMYPDSLQSKKAL